MRWGVYPNPAFSRPQTNFWVNWSVRRLIYKGNHVSFRKIFAKLWWKTNFKYDAGIIQFYTTFTNTYDGTNMENTNYYTTLPIPMIIPMYITQTVILHLPIPMMKQM